MLAIYRIQPDDRNHLLICKDEKAWPKHYTRISTREFAEILEGKASFVEAGLWSNEAKKTVEEIAKLFKEGKIEKVIIKNYAAVKPEFRFEAKPSEITIRTLGLTSEIYIRGGRVLKINPIHGITVYKEAKKLMPVSEESIRELASRIWADASTLMNILKRENLKQLSTHEIIILRVAIQNLERNIKELKTKLIGWIA